MISISVSKLCISVNKQNQGFYIYKNDIVITLFLSPKKLTYKKQNITEISIKPFNIFQLPSIFPASY